MLILILRHWT